MQSSGEQVHRELFVGSKVHDVPGTLAAQSESLTHSSSFVWQKYPTIPTYGKHPPLVGEQYPHAPQSESIRQFAGRQALIP